MLAVESDHYYIFDYAVNKIVMVIHVYNWSIGTTDVLSDYNPVPGIVPWA